jgi:hypothetical protein
MFKLIASLTVLGCLCACAAPPPPVDEFTAAWNEGERNENGTVAGAAYIQSSVGWLGRALTASSIHCSGDIAHHVRLVVQLNLDGSVRKAMVRPSSPYWECMKDAMAKKTYPAPPWDGYWRSTTLN